MATFSYTAARNDGSLITGELETADRASVVAYLQRQNLLVVAVEEKKVAQQALQSMVLGGFSASDRVLLIKHLATIIKAGLSIKEAVDILLSDAEKPIVKRILTEAKFNLEKGQPLSITFASYPKYFSKVFVNLIKAGESSGTLEQALDNLGVQLSRDYELVRKIRTAMVYPAVLLGGSIGVVVLLLTVVVPRLTKFFAQSGYQLPLITRILVGMSKLLTASPILTVIGLVGLVALVWAAFKTGTGKSILISLVGRLPIFSKLVHRVSLTRFARTLSTLLKSGLDILTAIKITSDAVGDPRYRKVLLQATEEISRGVSLNNVLRSQPELFPHLVTSMVSVGEKTGTLDSVLKTLSDFYEEEVDNALKTLVSLLEPLMLVIMGLVVGGIALAVILPIYQAVGNIR